MPLDASNYINYMTKVFDVRIFRPYAETYKNQKLAFISKENKF